MVKENFDEFLLKQAKELELKSTKDLIKELDKITKNICTFLKVERSGIWLYGENNESINCKSLYILQTDHYERDMTLFKKDFIPYFEALEHDRVIQASNAHTHHATSCFSKSYLAPLGLESLYDTPIWKADKVIGVLCLEYTQTKKSWSNEEKYFITSMADFIAKIFEKYSVLELIEDLENRVEQRTNELKAAQNLIIQNEKLTSLGSVVAGVSHELKNPLNLIISSSQMIEELLKDQQALDLEGLSKASLIIKDSAKRASDIITDMLNHAVEKEEYEVIDIKKLIKSSLSLVKISYMNHSKFQPAMNISSEKDYMIKGSRQKLQRVFINIFENAFYSLLEKTKKDQNFKANLDISISADDFEVSINIKDNGLGIKEEIFNKVFEPFYTTKSVGSGTGLGLSIAYDIIKKHNGSITIESVFNEYAKFQIKLPL